jgi:predicted  nucleic acid-binding Zn-ribbon protein
MHVEFELKKHIKTITKLEQQIDFLNDQRQGWEKDVKSFKEMGVSASYMQQLHVAQQQSAQVEGEYQQAAHRIQQLQKQLEERNQEVEKMEQAKQGVNVHAQEMLDEREQQLAELQRKVSRTDTAFCVAKLAGPPILIAFKLCVFSLCSTTAC